MPTYRGTQYSRPKHESDNSGNAWADTNRVPITANLTTADPVILMEVPSGTRLTKMRFRNNDLDTGTTLTANIGFRSKHSQPNLAANPTYFAAASTAFQAAALTSWTELVFEEIVFNEPVEITLIPAANGTGLPAAGNIWVQADGHVVGNN